MNAYYLNISEQMMEQSEVSILRGMERNREKIRLLRRLAALNGRYVTKRLDPKLAEILPEYAELNHNQFIGSSNSWSHRLAVHIRTSPSEGWYDMIHLDIANDTDRRVSMEMINKQIEDAQKEIEADAAALQSFRECAAQWNNLVEYAASIHGTISHCLRNLKDLNAEKIRRVSF